MLLPRRKNLNYVIYYGNNKLFILFIYLLIYKLCQVTKQIPLRDEDDEEE